MRRTSEQIRPVAEAAGSAQQQRRQLHVRHQEIQAPCVAAVQAYRAAAAFDVRHFTAG